MVGEVVNVVIGQGVDTRAIINPSCVEACYNRILTA
jgi:hypothetical protein